MLASTLSMPPCGLAGPGFTCFFTMLMPSIFTRSDLRSTDITVPCLPLLPPEITLTVSPFLTFTRLNMVFELKYLRGK